MTICGCEVICEWCSYSQLFDWRRALKYAEDIESSRQRAMQQLQDKLHEQYDEVRQLLDAKRHQQDEDNQQQAKHDEELRQEESLIAQLRAEHQRLEQDEAPARKKRKLQPSEVLKSSDTCAYSSVFIARMELYIMYHQCNECERNLRQRRKASISHESPAQ